MLSDPQQAVWYSSRIPTVDVIIVYLHKRRKQSGCDSNYQEDEEEWNHRKLLKSGVTRL